MICAGLIFEPAELLAVMACNIIIQIGSDPIYVNSRVLYNTRVCLRLWHVRVGYRVEGTGW